MRISNYTFNKYLSQTYIDNFEGTLGRAFKNKDITFLTFNRWKVFYEADPDNWKFYHDDYSFNRNDNIYFPYYFYIENGGNNYRLIKFPTKREYKKFYRFYRKNIEHNLDGKENQQEILELAQIIGQKATIRVEETQKKLQEDYKDYYKIVERCNKNANMTNPIFPTNFLLDNSKMTVTTTTTNDLNNFTFIPSNNTPYLVSLNKNTKCYENIGDNEDPIFMEKLNSFGYPIVISGINTVIEEKFYKGYTYCKLKGCPCSTWIRIADIKEKIT